MHDPRVVANYMLDYARTHNFKLTNLSLQKLIFFAHSISLVEKKKELVTGFFEAWEYGPVHPVVYQAFRHFGANGITEMATSLNPITREFKKLNSLEDPDARSICDRVMAQFGEISPGRLVDITHSKGGAWDYVVQLSKAEANVGLRISNKLIAEKHFRLKVFVTPQPICGEPDEDKPFARN